MSRPVSMGPIAFDATLWDEPTTGIGLYTRCLASTLEGMGVTRLRADAARGPLHLEARGRGHPDGLRGGS
jgi:hypothetical protein